MTEGIRVSCEDLETGETGEVTIQPGNYLLIVASPCYLANEQHSANGTTVITLKGRRAELMATRTVETDGASR